MMFCHFNRAIVIKASRVNFYGIAEEGDIMFPPTYRLKKGTRSDYSVEKVKKSGVCYFALCILLSVACCRTCYLAGRHIRNRWVVLT